MSEFQQWVDAARNTVKNGWKDNPGIVLMKSKDLVNWTHSKIVLKEDYKEHFSDAYWVR